MRIAMFTDSYYPEINGVANAVYTMYKQLTRLGHEVHVFAPSNKSAQYDPNVHRISSMPLVFLKDRRFVVYSPALLRRINHLKYDIVHTHSEFTVGYLGRTIAKMQNCVFVHTYHTIWEDYTYYVTRGVADEYARSMVRKYSRYWCNHCDLVIAPTKKTADLLRGYGVYTKVAVLPSGLDIARFSPGSQKPEARMARRRECGVPDGAKVLLNIGRIAREKNLDMVMGVLPRLFTRHPEALFVLVGEGPWIPVLKEQAEVLGIADRVLFTGPKPWELIHEYYAIGDVFVSASTSETQGLTYIEAMASGLFVVAKDDPALDGVITSGENGMLFKDAGQMELQLDAALSGSNMALSQRAIQSVAHYSQEAFAQNLEHIYQRLLYDHTDEERWDEVSVQ